MTKDTVGRDGRIRASLTPDCPGNERTRTVRQHRGKITWGSVIPRNPSRPSLTLSSSLLVSSFSFRGTKRESPDSTFRTKAREISCYNGAVLIHSLAHETVTFVGPSRFFVISHFLASRIQRSRHIFILETTSPGCASLLKSQTTEASGITKNEKYLHTCGRIYAAHTVFN